MEHDPDDAGATPWLGDPPALHRARTPETPIRKLVLPLPDLPAPLAEALRGVALGQGSHVSAQHRFRRQLREMGLITRGTRSGQPPEVTPAGWALFPPGAHAKWLGRQDSNLEPPDYMPIGLPQRRQSRTGSEQV